MSVTPRPVPLLRRALTPTMLAMAIALFAAGVLTPFFRVTQLWIFRDRLSVIDGLVSLADSREWFLFAIILVFTIVFPLVKLSVLVAVWWNRGPNPTRADRLLTWVAKLGKWSMLDVLVVAILVVATKSAAVAKVGLEPGVYLFTASVVLTQTLSLRLERRLHAGDRA